MTLLSITDADYLGTNYIIMWLMHELTSWRLRSVTTTLTFDNPRKIDSSDTCAYISNNRNDTLHVPNSRAKQTSNNFFSFSPSYKCGYAGARLYAIRDDSRPLIS